MKLEEEERPYYVPHTLSWLCICPQCILLQLHEYIESFVQKVYLFMVDYNLQLIYKFVLAVYYFLKVFWPNHKIF